METSYRYSPLPGRGGARDLPIRDGNMEMVSSIPSSEKARDLPIRDGNEIITYPITRFTTGPRPSYKGWKRVYDEAARKKGIEPATFL